MFSEFSFCLIYSRLGTKEDDNPEKPVNKISPIKVGFYYPKNQKKDNVGRQKL